MCRGCAGEEDWGLNLMDDLDDIAYEKVREARARLGRVRAAAKKMKDPKKKKEKGKEGKEAKGGMGLIFSLEVHSLHVSTLHSHQSYKCIHSTPIRQSIYTTSCQTSTKAKCL